MTASLAIAEYVTGQMGAAGLALADAPEEPVIPRMPELGERAVRAFADADKVRDDPAYGRIVCFCERATEGEVRDALGGGRAGGRRRRRAPPHPGHQRALSGLLLWRRHRGPRGPRGPRNERMSRTTLAVDALVVGAGPAGLAAAVALKGGGAGTVLVVEREDEAGGTPRLCAHSGFGLRDLRRVLSGPAYARRCVKRAVSTGVDIRTNSMVTGWAGPGRAEVTGPDGLLEVRARAVVLATGARERPRAARLVPGTRPAGVFTTGQLQQWVHRQQLPVGTRALIVGAEHVSYSAVLTLREAGVHPVALVTALPATQSYRAFDALTRTGLRVPLWTRTSVAAHRRQTAGGAGAAPRSRR